MVEFYDELECNCKELIELRLGGPVVVLNIPIGQWHTVRALESGTVIVEVKDGAYEPTGPEDVMGGIIGLRLLSGESVAYLSAEIYF